MSKAAYLAVANGTASLTWAWLAVVSTRALMSGCDYDAMQFVIDLSIALSGLELLHSFIGLTKTKPQSVALFVGARAFIGLYVCRMFPCSTAYMLTALAWGCGETVRLGCFAVDSVLPSRTVKTVRYTVGPLCFPMGSFGEWVLLINAAMLGRDRGMWILVVGWPIGFAALMKQLLAQRVKHMKSA